MPYRGKSIRSMVNRNRVRIARKRRKGRFSNNRQRFRVRDRNRSVVAVFRGLTQPDRLFVKFRYVDVTTPNMTISTLTSLKINSYRMNGLFDIHPSLLSTSVPGLAEMGAMYNRYRVRAVKLSFTCTNMSTQSLTMLLHAQSAFAPGNFTNWTNCMELISNRWSKYTILSPTGSGPNTKTLSMYVDLGALNGNKLEYESDENYTGYTNYGNTGSNPGKVMQCYCILFTTGGGAGDGIQNAIRFQMDLYTELFEKIDLSA